MVFVDILIKIPPTYLGHIDHVPFHDLQQCMLHTFPRYIPADAHVASRLANLVNFVNVDDAPLAPINVLTALKIQLDGKNNAYRVSVES